MMDGARKADRGMVLEQPVKRMQFVGVAVQSGLFVTVVVSALALGQKTGQIEAAIATLTTEMASQRQADKDLSTSIGQLAVAMATLAGAAESERSALRSQIEEIKVRIHDLERMP